MKKNIYISYQRDLDLVALYKEVGSKKFMNLVKESLRVLVRKNYTPVHKLPPEFMLSQFISKEEQKSNDYIRLQICLTSYKDDDIIHLLEHISDNKAGFFIKNALRFYIGPVLCLQGFLDDEFRDNLYHNSKLTQVFSLGSFESEKPVRKPRKQKTSTVRKQKRKETSNIESTLQISETRKNVEQNPVAKITTQTVENTDFPIISSPVNTDIIQENPNNSNMSEEDEMLSLLEGLLG